MCCFNSTPDEKINVLAPQEEIRIVSFKGKGNKTLTSVTLLDLQKGTKSKNKFLLNTIFHSRERCRYLVCSV